MLRKHLLRAEERFLARDDFLTTVAAGAVNATPATRGPGMRVGVDTESKISVDPALGAVFSGGKAAPADGDPGLWLDRQLARLSGRMCVGRVTPTAANTILYWGLDTNQAGQVSEGIKFHSDGGLYVVVNGSTGPRVGTYAGGVAYSLMVRLRAAGLHLYIKGGTYANWTRLFVSDTGSGGPYYAGIADNNAAGSVRTMRAPERLWVEAPLASDGFGGVVGTTDGLGLPEGGGGGVAWTAGAGWANSGGYAVNTPTPVDDERILNGGFDTNLANWTQVGAAASASVAGGQAGNCLQVVNDAGQYGHVYQGFATTVGSWYAVDLWHKSGSADGLVWVGTTGSGGELARLSYTAVNWTRRRCAFRAVGATTYLRIGCLTNAGAATTLFDSVSAKPLAHDDLTKVANVGTPEQVLEVDLFLPLGAAGGLVGRSDGTTGNKIDCFLENVTAGIYTVRVDVTISGVTTPNVITGTVAYSAGKKLKLHLLGSEVRAFYGGALVGSAYTTTLLTGNYAGVLNPGADSAGTPVQLDNWVCWAGSPNGAQFDKFFQGVPA